MRTTEVQLRLLMIAGMAGDQGAQSALLSSCAAQLRGYYRRRLGGRPDDVEDLVQETLMAIHRRRASYDPALPFTAWLFGIARYKLIDFLRRACVHATVALDEAPEIPLDPDGEAVLARLDVEKLLASLPSKQAEAIRLTRMEGLSVAEASQRSGQSESSIKVGAHRGLRRLGTMFQEKDR